MSQTKIPWKELGDRRLLLLGIGLVGLLLLAWPHKTPKTGEEEAIHTTEEGLPAAAQPQGDYAGEMEQRLEELLRSVDGVGQVKVMITLKTSEEVILQTDSYVSANKTSEQDAAGGNRVVEDVEAEEVTVLPGASAGVPYVVQEIMPQVEGIVVLCDGGGLPTVKTEISEAAAALFDVPAHKIKVLKRVSGKT